MVIETESKPNLAQMVEAAMQEAKGNPQAAAILLGWTLNRLRDYFKGCDPAQRERWIKREVVVPNEAQALHKPPLVALALPAPQAVTDDLSDVQLAEALAREDKAFEKGLEAACGGSESRLKMAVALQRLTHQFFRNTVEALHGGMFHNFLDLLDEKKGIKARLDAIRQALQDYAAYPLGSETRESISREEDRLAHQMREAGNEIIRTNEVVYRGAMVQAVMRSKEKKRKKFGYKQAMDVAATPA